MIGSDDSEARARMGEAMLARAAGDPRQEFGSFFLSRLLGFEVTYGDGSCTVSFPVEPTLFNPQGTLHGGVLATALDIAMGHLLNRLSGPGATLEMKVQYLAPISTGRVRCEASVLRAGRSVSFLQAVAYREDGVLAAHATATWKSQQAPRLMADDTSPKPAASVAALPRDGVRLRRVADLLGVPLISFFGAESEHALYASANGDRWVLRRDAAGAPIVRHIANAASGGHVSESGVGTFLERDRGSPQHGALLRLLDSLFAAFLADPDVGHVFTQ